MHVFYAPDAYIGLITLDENESQHAAKVLRLRAGETVHITNGKGHLFEAVISLPHHKQTTVQVTRQIETLQRAYKLHIAIAPTKNTDRFDWFAEKATEIGIDTITPIRCQYSERPTLNTDRHRRVITAAVKQSLGAIHPILHEVVEVKNLITQATEKQKFIAHCATGDKQLLKNACLPGTDTLILIGPEGDFSPDEIQFALQHGFVAISLGNSRLRTETAGIAACHTVALINQ